MLLPVDKARLALVSSFYARQSQLAVSLIFKSEVWRFGRCSYLLFFKELVEKIDTTLTSVVKYEASLSLAERLETGKQLAWLCLKGAICKLAPHIGINVPLHSWSCAIVTSDENVSDVF